MVSTPEQIADRCRLVKAHTDIFEGTGELLYIGASPDKMQLMDKLNYHITVLEIDHTNYQALDWPDKICGDVRDARFYFYRKQFDVTIWWHGPEHVYHSELGGIIEDLKDITSRTILLGCPFGYHSRSEWKDNGRHLSHLLPRDFVDLGFKWATHGPLEGENESCLIGWYTFGNEKETGAL